MILRKPTILVNRLVVRKNGKSVMDISFHEGLNIITGENSSGKTTAIRFIAYALGAENIGFNRVAQLCDDVYLQITANDAVVTLHRAVSSQIMRPLAVFWGDIRHALEASLSMWQQYPFKRSEHKESFSQVLFRLLEMPEVRGEGGANITMHQLMRLIYSDQETSSSDIFRYDRFDRGITRAAVGDYLLGIDASELYELKLEEGELDKKATALRVSVKTIYETFGHSGTNISLEFLDNQIQTLLQEVSYLQSKLVDFDSDRALKVSSSKEDNILREKLNVAHSTLSKAKQRKFELQAEIADSELFLRELEERLLSLGESAVAESYLGTAVFSFCPSCFTKIEAGGEEKSACALCKSNVAEDSARSQLARMRNELALQIKESEAIRTQQLDELNKISIEIPAAETHLKSLEFEFRRNQIEWRSPQQIEIQKISKQIGGKEQEIKNATELKKLADLLDRLTSELGVIEARLDWVRGRIEAVGREQLGRRKQAYLAVVDKLKLILSEDLDRQTEFVAAQEIDIDFAGNRIMIDGEGKFSASSMVFLQHSFHFALLLASLEQAYFRYPRMLILDGIEDGGMELGRSFNFQNIIAKYSENSAVSHQIIMTTTSVSPDLSNASYVVEPIFTHEKKSIRFDA
ncbi:AAA family ATPase [Achromobacter xylosoxidans]|nr:AAA family ATPase [Achromobacter xylosoxidans]BEG77012.1 hypothetical protein HBIAX_04097 [Achromobacter xylosoxidans]